MKENKFSAIFRKDLKTCAIACGISIHVNLIVDSPRSNKKMYDMYFVNSNHFVALEFKVVRGASISEDIVRVHQMDALNEVRCAGHRSYITVLIERTKKVWLLTPKEWCRLLKDGNKKIADFEDICATRSVMCIERRKVENIGTVWDLREIVDL